MLFPAQRRSGVTVTQRNGATPWMVTSQTPVATSQTLRVWSREAETTRRPSGGRARGDAKWGAPMDGRLTDTRRYVPDLEGVVEGSGDDAAAIGRDGACPD